MNADDEQKKLKMVRDFYLAAVLCDRGPTTRRINKLELAAEKVAD